MELHLLTAADLEMLLERKPTLDKTPNLHQKPSRNGEFAACLAKCPQMPGTL